MLYVIIAMAIIIIIVLKFCFSFRQLYSMLHPRICIILFNIIPLATLLFFQDGIFLL